MSRAFLRLAAVDGVVVDHAAPAFAPPAVVADIPRAIERLRHTLPTVPADEAVLVRPDVAATLLAAVDALAGREAALREWCTALLDVAVEACVRVDGAVDAETVATRIRAELQRLRELAAFQALQIEDLQAVLNERAAR